MVELVKESVPLAEKKPLMESAWATVALLIAKAAKVNRTRRLIIMVVSAEHEMYGTFPALDKKMPGQASVVG
jgi:hypothetical protein